MAKIGKVTFSNSAAAKKDQFSIFDLTINLANNLALLSQGDPGSAILYSVGVDNINGGTENMTQLPLGSSGSILVPTDLLIQDGAGYSFSTALGGIVTVLSASAGAVSYQASSDLRTQVDGLAAGAVIKDSFLYAIQIANGTVSWNSVVVNLVGQTASVSVTEDNGGVVEDVDGGVSVNRTLTDTVAVSAYAASGDATSFQITADSGNWGSLSSTSGRGAADFVYSIADSYIYDHSHAGYGEIAHADSFTVVTANGTTQGFVEAIYGNIHAAVYTGDASVAAVEGGAVGLNISAVDHDNNANLTYALSGLGAGDYLTDAADGAAQLAGSTIHLSAAQLAGLTLHAAEEETAALTLTVTNTETDASDNSVATAITTQTISLAVADAPLTAVTGANLSVKQGSPTGAVTVAAFTDGNPGDHSGDFTATIDWGDGVQSAGAVSYSDGVYSVTSTGHTYANKGHDVISVAINDIGASSLQIDGAAVVTPISTDVTGTFQGVVLTYSATGLYSGGGFDATRVFSPTIIKIGDTYSMYYGGEGFGNNYQMGLATSTDGVHWTRYAGNPVIGNNNGQSWDSWQEKPISVEYKNGAYRLWFWGDNSNLDSDYGFTTGFGSATSPDGVHWTLSPSNPIVQELNVPHGTSVDLRSVVDFHGSYIDYYLQMSPSGRALESSVSSDGANFPAASPVASLAGYDMLAATTTDQFGVEAIFALVQKAGVDYYATSLDGANFRIGGVYNPPSQMLGANSILFEDGLMKLYGVVDAGNAVWGYGDINIGYATVNVSDLASGASTFTGGAAGDVFNLKQGFGDVTITDFASYATGAGRDTISFTASEFSSFAQVQAAATAVGGDLVISGQNGDRLTLLGLSALTNDMSADFVFRA